MPGLRTRKKITLEIDKFNSIIEEESNKMDVDYIGVAKSLKNMSVQPSLIANDSLHPSKRMYKIWAKKLQAKGSNHQLSS